MPMQQRFLVFGATGGTGRHFVAQALEQGHLVRALARNVQRLPVHDSLDGRQGSISDSLDLDALLGGVDSVAIMLGDVEMQKTRKVNTAFIELLVPAMRRTGVSHLLYQAGGLSAAPGRALSTRFWMIRNTLARDYIGQHQDNEAVMTYLVENAADIQWVVHRAGISGDGPSAGRLRRSESEYSVATFRDVAAHNHALLVDQTALHTCDLSTYEATSGVQAGNS